jgi:hypothetical protein
MAVTDTHATTEELSEALFSVRSVPRLYNEDQLPLRESLEMTEEYEVDVGWPPACEDVSPEAEESPLLKMLPSTAVKTVTENASLCDL